MSEEVQPGVRIDATLWERFRQDVKSRNSVVRGNLRRELETALRQYLDGGDPTSAGSVDERLSRIEAAVGVTNADGGVDTFEAESHAHTPTEKPAPNGPSDEKVAYLAECVLDAEVPHCRELATVPKAALRDVVKAEYSFRRDTAKRYVQDLIDYFDLRPHPSADGILVTEAKLQDIQDNE